MSYIKLGLCILLSFASSGVSALDLWSGTKSVVSVQVVSNGGFIINLDSEINLDCSHAGSSALLIYPEQNGVTEAGAKSLLSTALIAFTTGNKVNIMYSNDSAFCWGKYLLISK